MLNALAIVTVSLNYTEKGTRTCLQEALPCFLYPIQLSFTQKAPYRLLGVIGVLSNIQPELLRGVFEPISSTQPVK
jgi:hypothetical protein